ncbi:Gfo/Idh/MocA family protein [Sphingobacterium sp. IITKGP-BTPF85]|uniref:Gfo/Idh/MocA family protein n=1 Tax=Sphingobacterium sp. IITKGP-BTPF85 TaxID=1338009 RepID=UPI000389E83F|nr:Gfo/Idh/MocA family oxidoreductase [Sphingobacterium sp. IITKGP-BTPF85]KKX51736.1 oxidoreductase [Sphingobacterium sp. IITKGP-BTPF85]
MKVLIVGLGSIAQKHILALVNYDSSIELYALRRSVDATIHHTVKNIVSLDEVDNITFAIISNPTSEHANAIKLLAEKNIPLFIEKPVFESLNYSHLVDFVKEKNLITYVACNLRFLECLQYVKNEIIIKKRINEINVYCGSYLPDWRRGIDFRTVYSANKNEGGGVHIDLIHEMDYVYWLFEKPQTVRKFYSSLSSLNITSYDYANYLLSYPEFNINIQLNYYRRDPKRTLEIVCEEGTYLVDLLTNTIYLNSAVIFESNKRILDTYQTQLNFFINDILNNKKSFNDIEEAYEILKLCLED